MNPDWIHTMAVTSSAPLKIKDFENDLEREVALYGIFH